MVFKKTCLFKTLIVIGFHSIARAGNIPSYDIQTIIEEVQATKPQEIAVIKNENKPIGAKHPLHLYPIGFSRNGYFAYFSVRNYQEVQFFLNIVSLINDKKPLIKKIKLGHAEETINQITEDLNRFNIELNLLERRFYSFPYNYTHNRISESYSLSINENEDLYIIDIVSDKQGNKNIAKIKKDDDNPYINQVIGLIKSPHEERVAIIIGGYRYGGHHDFYQEFFVIGAHLKIGFNKKKETGQSH